MKHAALLVIALNIYSLNIYPQSQMLKAKIVTLSNDTVSGQIKDYQWNKNPDELEFTRELQSASEIIRPGKIKAAIIDSGDYYVSAILHIDMEYAKLDNPSEVYSTDTVIKDTVFLRLLLKGTLSLYLFTDENQKSHFFGKTDFSDYQELYFKNLPMTYQNSPHLPFPIINSSSMKDATQNSIKTDNFVYSVYKEQLESWMSFCPDARQRISNVNYKEKSLISLFEFYNDCIPSGKVNYKYSPPDTKARFYIVGGAGITKIHFSGDKSNQSLDNETFSKSINPTAAIAIEFPFTRQFQLFSFLTELQWKNFKTESHSESPVTFNKYSYTFAMNYLKFNAALQYRFCAKKVQPNINGGITFAYLLSSENKKQIIDGNTGQLNERAGLDGIRGYDFGYFASAGVNIKRWGISFRYEHTLGFSDFLNIAAPINTINCLLSFRLNKI